MSPASRRADVNHRGLHGASALMWAAEEGQFEATLPICRRRICELELTTRKEKEAWIWSRAIQQNVSSFDAIVNRIRHGNWEALIQPRQPCSCWSQKLKWTKKMGKAWIWSSHHIWHAFARLPDCKAKEVSFAVLIKIKVIHQSKPACARLVTWVATFYTHLHPSAPNLGALFWASRSLS